MAEIELAVCFHLMDESLGSYERTFQLSRLLQEPLQPRRDGEDLEKADATDEELCQRQAGGDMAKIQAESYQHGDKEVATLI